MKGTIKILTILLMVMFSSLMVNAVVFSDNQADNFAKLGSNSVLSMINPAVLDNSTLSLSTPYKLILTTTDTYFVFTSQSGQNESINFGYNTGTGWVTNTYQINSGENLYLAFTPQVVDDTIDVQISNPTGQISYSIISFNDNQRGINDRTTIFTPFITGVTDLININISIWKIVYYLFILVIIISFIVGIVYIAYKWYKFTDKHSIYGKKKHSNFKK